MRIYITIDLYSYIYEKGGGDVRRRPRVSPRARTWSWPVGVWGDAQHHPRPFHTQTYYMYTNFDFFNFFLI
jgi:hypothetical protein